MNLELPVHVLSDTHIGHTASLVRDPRALAPLFDGASTVVFNGDTVEMLWKPNRARARQQKRAVTGAVRRSGARPVFVSGNHDPFVSEFHHLDLWDGELFVTHGDVLFQEVAPWSRDADVLGPERERILDAIVGGKLEELERHLLASKCASLALEMREPCSPGGVFPVLRMALRETWPPWRVLRILRFWSETPARADELASRFRPAARFVVIGHTHHPGCWAVGDRTVVNTGAYLPFSRRNLVRITERTLEVRRVIRRRGEFRLGERIATYERRGVAAEIPSIRARARAEAEPSTRGSAEAVAGAARDARSRPRRAPRQRAASR